GGPGAGVAIDFDNYDPRGNAPPLRIQSIDDGLFSSHLVVQSKQSGLIGNALVERLRLTNDGRLCIGTSAPDGDQQGRKVLLDVAGAIRFSDALFCNTRMHLSGGAECYFLHSQGVVVSKAWGGSGNLTVEGTTTSNTVNVDTGGLSIKG